MESRSGSAGNCRAVGLRILLMLAVCAAAPALEAQAAPTAVNCGIVNADGSGVSGAIQIIWPTFASGSATVLAGQLNFTVTAGVCSPPILLIPTDTATGMLPYLSPAYTVKTNNGGKTTESTWCVPTSGSPVSIASIQVAGPPCPTILAGPSWTHLTNSQWTSLTNSQWTSLTN